MKYRVYAIATASWLIGTYEADSPDAAVEMANKDNEAEFSKSLCHQCADEMEVGDCYETQVEKVAVD